MNSPEDSSPSSTQKTLDWADQQTATQQPGVSPPSPTHCFEDGEGTSSANPSDIPVSTNPSSLSQTFVTPQKKRTAEKITSDASQPQGGRRKRGRPPKHKKPQTDTEHQIHQAQSPTATHPCLQPEDKTEAVTLTPNSPVIPEDRCQSPDAQTKAERQLRSPSSPVPEDRCQSPEATSELPCPTLDLQRPNKGQSKNGPHLSSASVGQGDTTGPNVLTTGGYRYSQATEARVLGAEPSQNDSITATGIFLRKCAKEQRTLCQSPHTLRDGRKAAKKSQIHKGETVRNGENTSKPLPTIKVERENCLTQKTGRKRKYKKKSQSHKVDQPRDTDQSPESETMRNGENISIKSPTRKIDWSQETVRKRTYTNKSQTPKVDQSQESVTKKKKASKISPINKGEESQETVIKRKYTKKTQRHKGDTPQETDQSQKTVRNGKNTSIKSPTHQVDQSQESVTNRKKVFKISSTHKVDHTQETVKKRKCTKKSQSQEETEKKPSMKSQTNKVDQVASRKSQRHMVEQSLGIDQSQETVRKRNYTKKSQSHKEDFHETVRNGEKTSKKSKRHKVELQDTEQSQEEVVKNRKYTKKSKTRKVDSGVPSSLPVLSADLSPNLSSPTLTPPGIPFSPNTPKRVRGRPQRVQQQLCLSSTPGPHPRSSTGTDNPFSVSLSQLGLGSKTQGPQNASPITPCKLLELSPLEKTHLALRSSKPRGGPRDRPRKHPATVKGVKTQGGKKEVKAAGEGGSQTFSSEEGPPAKRRHRSRKGQTAEGTGLQSNDTTSAEPLQRSRPRFELQESDSPDKETGDASLSSDLSIELSVQEDHVTSLILEEEEEEQEDEEDLPSFLNNTKPLSITEGICVWCKFRNYPFWPAMVKSVNRKLKKASIVFIDDLLFDKKRIRKGFSVALKTLKPFDCEEAVQLVCKAREKYDAAITWCLALIADYRIRIGCGFTGSFIEYFSDDISCPVRRRYPQDTSDLTFPSKLILEEQCVTSDPEGVGQEGSKRQEEERRRKLLPDRSKAARNRANEKLVDFIVRQRRVETRLLGVISGQQQSKWLHWFLVASRSVVDTYLEDEEQLDQVYQYLRGVYESAALTAPCLADVDCIRLVLDVLLPEAIIYAIAGVDELSLVKAEDKYLKGPCLSKREREEFDAMIEQQMKMKASIRQRPAH